MKQHAIIFNIIHTFIAFFILLPLNPPIYLSIIYPPKSTPTNGAVTKTEANRSLHLSNILHSTIRIHFENNYQKLSAPELNCRRNKESHSHRKRIIHENTFTHYLLFIKITNIPKHH
jgi:hypothetical protein